tara:strand:+ start:2354 stop:2563 length:210 start_codon:yes stop_codon:yes gene_type:complete
MEEHLTTIAVGLVIPTILGMFGFLWKVNARISRIERDLKAHDNRIGQNTRTLQSHFEKAFTIRKSISDI